ncbi:CBS domain-containing protein [Flavihumibacter sp. R14]|nr:CBS domain-containing protein [Flavihumibacter soli]
MLARELISDAIPPLRTSDTVEKVLDRMAEFRVNHLPIVNESQILGLICEEDLIEVQDYQTEIGGLNLSLRNYSVFEDQHVYDLIRMIHELRLTVIPVLDHQNNYLGLVSLGSLVEYFATLTATKEPGGIIVLEISNRDNSLAHVAQIVESENAQILSSYVKSYPDSTKLELTLKLNRNEISTIVASFLRYDYIIKATFNDLKADERTQDRYDQLMNYLDI